MRLFPRRVSKKAGLSPGALVHVGERKTEETQIRIMFYDEHTLEERELDTIEETIKPATARKDMANLGIRAGQVTGIKQIASGLKDGKKLIKLDLEISAGAEDPHDAVTIYGTPDMKVRVMNGTSGDLATASALVNAIPQVVNAQPGLAAMGSQIFPKYAPSVNVRIML